MSGDPATKASGAWVVVATYNEAENLGPLLDRLEALPSRLGVCVVDDASPDGTGELADARAEALGERMVVLHRAGKLGYASAHREGMRAVLDRGAEVVVTMDADLSHAPETLSVMLERLAEADVVIGSRYVAGGRTVNWSVGRVLLSRLGGSLVTRLLTGLRQADCTSGFRAYRRAALLEVDPWTTTAEGYGFLVELLFRCQRQGARIVEVPIVFHDRRAGRSKLSRRIILESALLCFSLAGQRLAGRGARTPWIRGAP
jgi:dolichol-phosphate mannosyltransferase